MITPPWYQDKVETLAFNAMCFHQNERELAIQAIASGNTSIDCADDMSDEDIAYIEKELYNRYGIIANISAS